MALDPKTWTLKTQEAVNAAIETAASTSNPEVVPDHLLTALLGQEDGVVLPVIRKIGLNPVTLRDHCDEVTAALPKSYGSNTQLSRELTDIFERATTARLDL